MLSQPVLYFCKWYHAKGTQIVYFRLNCDLSLSDSVNDIKL